MLLTVKVLRVDGVHRSVSVLVLYSLDLALFIFLLFKRRHDTSDPETLEEKYMKDKMHPALEH